tara:strand:+ start:352 stop:606 length:255 start_codon:yes stop_codon:yes gene_type:complete
MQEPNLNINKLKNMLDNFLVVNLFLIILGFILFLIGVVTSANGNVVPYHFFQRLWFPLFIPALSTFFTAVLVQGLWNIFSKTKI